MQKIYGDIVKFSLPKGDQVWIYHPDDKKKMLEHDGKMPIIPSIGRITYYRKNLRKDLYPQPGIVTNGEEWLNYRSTINADLSKKNCMMPYLKDIETISNDLIDLFEREKDQDGKICFKAQGGLFQRWALENICFIFLGDRLGTLKENVTENSDGMRLIKDVDTVFDEHL